MDKMTIYIKRYHYKILEFSLTQEIETTLNQYGDQGWEIVAVTRWKGKLIYTLQQYIGTFEKVVTKQTGGIKIARGNQPDNKRFRASESLTIDK